MKYKPIPELSEEDKQRFFSKVHTLAANECWPWLAYTDEDGYGELRCGKKSYKAHRIAYYLGYNVDPGESLVLHTCDNPPCCNPLHLVLGTPQDNSTDMMNKGRAASGERHGSRTHPERVARGDRHMSRTHPEARPRGDNHWTRSRPDEVLRGTDNPAAKLTEQNVRDIRKEPGTAVDIGKKFDVSGVLVSKIKKREIWKHVA